MYKAGIIGLGPIAAMYGKPGDSAPYCHVGGILKSGRVDVASVADLSEEKLSEYKKIWGGSFPDCRYYKSAVEMLDSETIDIAAVCVRGPHHFGVMMDVLEREPRAVFLEKPPACSLEEMDAMTSAARELEIPITVSYSRHWVPHVLRLQELVTEGIIGEVKAVISYCGGGVLSFASHGTDLMCQFAGYDPAAVYARGAVFDSAPEGYEPEPELLSMTVEFKSGVIGMQSGFGGAGGAFSCEVFGTEGMVRAGKNTPPFGIDKQGNQIDFKHLGIPSDCSVFRVAYDQIADYLDGGPIPHCTGEHFTAVNEIGFGAVESILTGMRIELPNSNRGRKIFANG